MPDYMLGTQDPKIRIKHSSGRWNSERADARMSAERLFYFTYQLHMRPIVGIDAAKHFLHYLGATGKPYEINLQN